MPAAKEALQRALTFLGPATSVDSVFFDKHQKFSSKFGKEDPGANPTIVSYTSAVKIYNSTNSLVRFLDKNYFLLV
jgi:hypothetical protein